MRSIYYSFLLLKILWLHRKPVDLEGSVFRPKIGKSEFSITPDVRKYVPSPPIFIVKSFLEVSFPYLEISGDPYLWCLCLWVPDPFSWRHLCLLILVGGSKNQRLIYARLLLPPYNKRQLVSSFLLVTINHPFKKPKNDCHLFWIHKWDWLAYQTFIRTFSM